MAPDPPIDLSTFHDRLGRVDPYRLNGRVVQVIGLVIEAQGPEAQVGELCHVHVSRHEPPVAAEVVGFREGRTLLTETEAKAVLAACGVEVPDTVFCPTEDEVAGMAGFG